MSCICWNVCGLENCGTFLALCHLMQNFSLDLVFLTETELSQSKAESIHVRLNFSGCFSVARRGESGGLMLLW